MHSVLTHCHLLDLTVISLPTPVSLQLCLSMVYMHACIFPLMIVIYSAHDRLLHVHLFMHRKQLCTKYTQNNV